MAITAEEIRILVRAETDKARRELDKFKKTSKSTTLDLKQLAKSLIGPIGVTAGIAAVAAIAKKAIGGAIRYAASVEQISVAFEVLLGSAGAAQDVLGELRQFAVKTPFTFEELAPAAKRLLAFGTTAEDVVDVMRDLGNAAAGNGETLNRLVDAYGKVQAKGRASLEELNRFTEAGVPLMRQLAEDLEMTNAELFKFISAGKLGFKQVNRSLQNLTRGEGQFAGMLEAQSKTLEGVMSTLKGAVQDLGLAFADDLIPFLTTAVTKLTEFVTGVTEVRNLSEALGEVWVDKNFMDFGGLTGAALGEEAVRKFNLVNDALDLHIVKRERLAAIEKPSMMDKADLVLTEIAIADLEMMAVDLEEIGRRAGVAFTTYGNGIDSVRQQTEELNEVLTDEDPIDHMKLLADAFAKTLEGQKQALEDVIAEWETFEQVGRVLPILRDARADLAAINEEIAERDLEAWAAEFPKLANAAKKGIGELKEPIEEVSILAADMVNVLAFPFAEGGGEAIGTRASAMKAFMESIKQEAEELIPVIDDLGNIYNRFGMDVEMASQLAADAMSDLARNEAQELKEAIDRIVDSMAVGFLGTAGSGALDALRDIGAAMTDVTGDAKGAAFAISDFVSSLVKAMPQMMFSAGLKLALGGSPEVGLLLILASGLLALGIGLFEGSRARHEITDGGADIPDSAQIQRMGVTSRGDTITIVNGNIFVQDELQSTTLGTMAAAGGNR